MKVTHVLVEMGYFYVKNITLVQLDHLAGDIGGLHIIRDYSGG